MTINEIEDGEKEMLAQETDWEDEIDDENSENDEDEEEIELFDPTKIRVKTKQMTMDLLLKRIKHEEINLAPDFQRNPNIWNRKAQSRLIESLLIRIPLPAFYIDATDDTQWLIIDGLQRISTFKSFILDRELKLTGLEFLSNELDNKTYNQLSRDYQRRIDETELTLYLIEPGTPDEVKYRIFQRINTGGLPLNNQELRQAINPGQANKILKNLASLSEFKRVTNLSKNRKNRLDDHEFVLGFIAFRLTKYQDYPTKKGRNYFLHEAMKKLNKIDKNLEKKLEQQFIIGMKAAYNIFGEDTFRKILNNSSKKSPVNKALFECWSVALSQLNEQEIETLINKKEKLKELFIQKMESDPDFLKSISQAANKVQYRFSKINKMIEEVLSCSNP
ncbi:MULTISPECIES: DUF262 domain-containing protein [unclassified Microcoleus]|uniref:DUF262 domain-containing protein n=1 Tax=unclassified Microcoleus TaxID=2642155 RepID=UPI002FD211D7